MNKELKKKRLELLAEIDTFEQECEGCDHRTYYHELKDATGLMDACRICPVFEDLKRCGDQLLSLTGQRKTIEE